MDHFFNCTILPDPEFSESVLLNVLYAKLHGVLANQDGIEVGVSFPNAKKRLGNILRLHGSEASVAQLHNGSWHNGMKDHITVSEIELVPLNCRHHEIRRVQVKSSIGRVLRRSVANGRMSEQEARQRLGTARSKRSKLPYLQVKSRSTGQAFKLFVSIGKSIETSTSGDFNAYGFSRIATVPCF